MTHKLIDKLIDSEGDIYRTPKSRIILSVPDPVHELTPYNVLFGHDYEPYLANLTPAAPSIQPIENVPQKINQILTFDYSKNEDDPCDIRAKLYSLAIDANDKLLDIAKTVESKLIRTLIQFRGVADQSIIPLIKTHLQEVLSKCTPIEESEKASIEGYINKKLSEFEPVLTEIIKSEVAKINVSTTEIKENITIYRNLVEMLKKYELHEIELLTKHNKEHQKQLHGQIEEKMKELEELFNQIKKDPLDGSTKEKSVTASSAKEEIIAVNVHIENAPVSANSKKTKILEAQKAQTIEAYEKYMKSISEGVSEEEAMRIFMADIPKQ